jgi:cytochrome oxidase Cu insertion factor (SCO1/SenC/PrrC family)
MGRKPLRTVPVTQGLSWILAAALLVGSAGGAGAQADPAPDRSAAELMDALMWNREPVGGSFSLVDQTGKVRTDAEFRGKLLVIYFGYTYCPDICPTDLQSITQAADTLDPAATAIQPLFITIDPERDTPEHLAQYVPSFSPRLIGLTGSPDAVRRVALAYKVYYAKAPLPTSSDYTIDHTGFIYLVDPAGLYLGFLPPGTPADRLEHVLREHLPAGAGSRR